MDIDRSISLHICLFDNVDDFFSRKFFVLCSFCDKWLIRIGANIGIEEIFFMIALLDRIIGRLEARNIRIDLEVLILIKPDEIELIEDEKNECDEDIDKVCTQRIVFRYCNSGRFSYNIEKLL